jgi:P27 family predicted phage terminase small subunit
MGRRGPRPTPTKILNLRGSRIRGAKDGVEPEAVAPICPPGLSRDAREEWGRIVPDLDRLGILARIDHAALVTYCESWSSYREHTRKIRKEGWLVKTQWGRMAANPRAGLLNAARSAMLRFQQEFGLTPSARTRIKASPEAKKDPLGDFVKRKYEAPAAPPAGG